MKIKSEAFRKFKNAVGGRLHSLVSCLTLIEWIIIMAIIGILGVVAYDVLRTPDIYVGKVYDRQFTPAHTTTSMVMSGKVMIPQTIFHPNRWRICIEDTKGEDRLTECFPVAKHVYDKTDVGETADFSVGN